MTLRTVRRALAPSGAPSKAVSRGVFSSAAAVLLSAALLSACGGPADSSPPPPGDDSASSFEVLDHVGAANDLTYAVDTDGHRAVFGRGSEVVVADVSDPHRPRELRTIQVGGEVRGLSLAGRLAFAAADTAGLQIVDIETGEVLGSMRFEDRVWGVDHAGNLVYVAARSDGLHVVDVGDPSAPVALGHLETPDEAVDVVVENDLAYVAAWYESLRTVDVSDPSNPTDLSFAPFDSYDHGAVWGVAASGDLAVAAVPQKGLRIVNVSDPAAVTNHRMYRDLHAPAAAALRGRTAFVADQDAGLRVLDLTDPASPTEIGRLELPGRPLDIRLVGTVAYVASKSGGLRLVDVSVPNRPVETGYLDAGDEVVDVASAGGTLLAAGAENGVYRYGDEGLELLYEQRSSRIRIIGERVLASGSDGVAVYEEGRLVAEVPGEVHAAGASNDVLAAAGPLGVHFFDVASGSARELGTVTSDWQSGVGTLHRAPPAAWDVVMDDSRAFAAFDNGIYEIDMSTGAPSRGALLTTPERAYRLAVSGDTLYAACDDGLRMIDVSAVGRMTEVAYWKTPSFATALLVEEDRVYVGDLSGRITVVDRAGGHPSGTWEVADQIRALARTPAGIAVAAGRQGLLVVSLKEPVQALGAASR